MTTDTAKTTPQGASKLACPLCGDFHSIVTDSRGRIDSIRRRRQCLKCGQRFTTFETIEDRRSARRDLVLLIAEMEALLSAVKQVLARTDDDEGLGS